MKKTFTIFVALILTIGSLMAQSTLSCDFTVAAKACIQQDVLVAYTGGAAATATYTWHFDGGIIISGAGQGPYHVKWETTGEKHLTLTIVQEGNTCTANRTIVIITQPELYYMTGGGNVVPGGPGVEVGLSGAQTGIIYKLRLNGVYTGVQVSGNSPISFGLMTAPGHYTAVAKVDGCDCTREMEGVAVVTANEPPQVQPICMVTFDTITNHNKIVWNKPASVHISHYNIFRETYQTNEFTKIGEVAYSALSVFLDPSANPLIKSDKYELSVSDSLGNESVRSAYHKTIHLNINPGILGFNLIWNPYEGFDYKTYKIHRKATTGPWLVIDSIAGNITSYTDFYTGSGTMSYYIEVVRPEPCHPLKSGETETVISNTAMAAPLGIATADNTGILVYPNPATDKVIVATSETDQFNAIMSEPDGKIVLNSTISGPKATIDVSAFHRGLYLLKLTSPRFSIVRKIVLI